MVRCVAACLLVFAVVASAPAQLRQGADATALLQQGSALISAKPGEAVKLLQEARRLDPDRAEIRYQLALAFDATGDLADAKAELREVLSRAPNSAEAHNYLGIILFKSGDAKSAAEEFRACVRIGPNDPNAHFNLGQALAAMNDKAAAGELQAAAALAPGDAVLTRVAKAAEASARPVDALIKVDVRQVVVPVVVTDRQGHHVTGLTQQDFQVLEDGIEQKITAFAVEHSGLSETGIGSPAKPSAGGSPVSSVARQATARRTYLICIDTLHASFNNFVAAREALKKVFAREHSEDSQYVVVALGTTAQVVVNTTRSSAAVLAAFQDKRFQSLFLSGQQGGLKPELERYRRDLNETRENCDLYNKTREMPFQVKCQVGITRAPQEAELIADLDRTLTIGFLRQLRHLVTQLSQARDRRTIIMMSEGFQIVPGREAYDLLHAFFPDLKGNTMQSGDRLQSEFEPILKVAAASNITIDTIDSRGLYGLGSFDASNQGSAVTVAAAVDRVERNMASANGNTLAEIAQATGGTAFHDSNDLSGGLERAFADGRDYYTIAYVSTNAKADRKFRAIVVQVRGRDITINAKRGYWPEGPDQ